MPELTFLNFVFITLSGGGWVAGWVGGEAEIKANTNSNEIEIEGELSLA